MSTAAITHHRRPVWPALNFLVAGAALAVGVVAITSDDVAPLPKPASVERPVSPVAAPMTDRAGDCGFRVSTPC